MLIYNKYVNNLTIALFICTLYISAISLLFMQTLFKHKDRPKEELNTLDKLHVAQLRVQKDLDELIIGSNVTISKPDPKNIMNLIVTVTIENPDSFWCGGTYDFIFKFGVDYPIKPPLCYILTPIFPPNIEATPEGRVCFSIIYSTGWKPEFTLTEIIAGLQYVFLEPDSVYNVNNEAAKMMDDNKKQFIEFVHKTLKGGNFYGLEFKKFI